jgi:hypothetical protein
VTVLVSAVKMFWTSNKLLCPLPGNHVDFVYGAIQVQTFEQLSQERWTVHLLVLVKTLYYIVTCRAIRVTKITGFPSDDWIY